MGHDIGRFLFEGGSPSFYKTVERVVRTSCVFRRTKADSFGNARRITRSGLVLSSRDKDFLKNFKPAIVNVPLRDICEGIQKATKMLKVTFLD
jgi:hypothetical protein